MLPIKPPPSDSWPKGGRCVGCGRVWSLVDPGSRPGSVSGQQIPGHLRAPFSSSAMKGPQWHYAGFVKIQLNKIFKTMFRALALEAPGEWCTVREEGRRGSLSPNSHLKTRPGCRKDLPAICQLHLGTGLAPGMGRPFPLTYPIPALG